MSYFRLFGKIRNWGIFPVMESLPQTQWDDELLSVLSVGAVCTDSHGRVLKTNTQFLKETETAETEMTGRELSQFFTIYLGNRDIFPGLVERLQAGEERVDFPSNAYIQIRESKKKFFVKGQAIGYYHKNKVRRILLLFRNIEAELTQEFIFNLASTRTKIFPWFFNIEQNKIIIDMRWFAHLGIPTEDGSLSAEEFASFVHPDDRDVLLDALSAQIKGILNTDSFTYRLRHHDGSYEWFEERSRYMGEVEGTPYRIVGVCQSIQEHKQVEEKLIAARNKAEESDQLKSAFLANMSHEIRTPLNAIVGFSNLLTNEEISLETEEKQEYSRLINTNSEQLLRLISDILDLSKIESNTMEFSYAEYSMHDLLSDVYEAQRLNMPPAVKLLIDLPAIPAHLHTDSLRLKQVLNNLINNAVRFTSSGSITLGYYLTKDGQQVELFVKDTGTGIPEDKQQMIFERFYKADTFQRGVGLGLSICKTIMQTLGGSISLTSKPGEGSCFMVSHPLHR